jgi:hypothetical protein
MAHMPRPRLNDADNVIEENQRGRALQMREQIQILALAGIL